MSKSSQIAPDGWHAVTPRIFATNARQMVEFLTHTFGASGEYRIDRPSVIQIGDSIVMVTGAELRGATATFLYVYVTDVDSAYERALECGATSIEAPQLVPYGDRRCMVKDPSGNTWQIATRAELL